MSQSCDPCDACGAGCGRIVTPAGVLCRTCADALGQDLRRDRL